MSEIKHTPGPWAINGGLIGPEKNIFTDPSEAAVCVVGIVNHQTPQDTANARLIAKAPDMAAQIDLLRQENERMRQALAAVKEACDDAFYDDMVNGQHTTTNFCPLCGSSYGCDDDCPLSQVIYALKSHDDLANDVTLV